MTKRLKETRATARKALDHVRQARNQYRAAHAGLEQVADKLSVAHHHQRAQELRADYVDKARAIARPALEEITQAVDAAGAQYTHAAFMATARFTPPPVMVPKLTPYDKRGWQTNNPAEIASWGGHKEKTAAEAHNLQLQIGENLERLRWQGELPRLTADELTARAVEAGRENNAALLVMIKREARARPDAEKAPAMSAVVTAEQELALPAEFVEGAELIDELAAARAGINSALAEVETGQDDIVEKVQSISKLGGAEYLKQRAERLAAEAAQGNEHAKHELAALVEGAQGTEAAPEQPPPTPTEEGA